MQETFAQVLKGLRLKLDLTQEGLAEAAGVSPQAISLLERGVRRFPQRVTLDRLADALRLSPTERSAFERLAARGVVPTDPTDDSLSTGTAWSIPRELPMATTTFVGRRSQLSALVGRLTNGSARPGSPTLATIQGMAGVGKTALALQVAHSVAGRYPDGAVFVDLRGFGPGAPMTPLAALGQILRATGVSPDDVPGRLEDAAATYRTRLADRKMLVVLDNAVEVAQVDDLLPAAPGCSVVITSRNTLTTIGAGLHLQLDPMSRGDSLDLLTAISGADRSDPDAQIVAELCGNLPLAISVAGAWLARRPEWTPTDLAARLGDESRRLDLLGSDDLDVRTSLSFSIEQLAGTNTDRDTAAIRALALLSIPDGPDITAEIAAPLLNVSSLDADRALERLVDLHLLESASPGRYHLHDLVRTYAGELVAPDDRTVAFDRYLSFHVAAAWRVTELSDSGSVRMKWYSERRCSRGPEMTSTGEGINWLERELANVLSLISQAASLPEHSDGAAGLVIGLFRYFTGCGHLSSWLETIDTVLEAEIEPWCRAQLDADAGIALAELGRFDESLARLSAAAQTFETAGDVRGQSLAANNMARLLNRLGRFHDARPFAEHALELNSSLADVRGIGRAILSLSEIYGEIGDHQAELEHVVQARELYREAGDVSGAANSLIDAAVAYSRLGLTTQALTTARQGLAELERLGLTANRSDGYCWLGWILARGDRHQEAVISYEAGLELALDLTDHRREAQIRRRLGTSQLALADTDEGMMNLEFASVFFREHNPRAADQISELLDNPDLATEVARRPGLL
ncbi:tetratricopeptide repeat protein [Kribbella sp. NPDC056861]|uniref:ATP-binding protein n=1 Tax=Kribbella sp. NPDC056861 TaxID=3154857 RepID=UPI003444E528